MENMDNNMGEFFRKQLSENQGAGQEWDTPDPHVRAEVLDTISPTKPAPINGRGGLLIFSGAVVILLLLGYIWRLEKRLELLENPHELREELIGDYIEAEAAQLEGELIWKREMEEKLETQQQQIAQLEAAQQASTEQIRSLSHQLFWVQQKQQVETAPGDSFVISQADSRSQFPAYYRDIDSLQKPTQTLTVSPHRYRKMDTRFPFPQPLEPSHTQSVWEIGYEASSTTMGSEADGFAEGFRTVSSRISASPLKLNLHAFNLSYSPKRNWWIQTGIRAGKGFQYQEGTLTVAYDPSGEEEDRVENARINTIELDKRTPYQQSKTSLTISIPEDRRIQQDELLEIRFEEKQPLTVTQVPLGIGYEFGKGPFVGLIQAGLQGSRIRFGPSETQYAVLSREREVDIKRSGTLYERGGATLLLGAYGGLGLGWNLYKGLGIRGSLAYSRYFSNRQSGNTDLPIPTEQNLRFGLYYRF